MNKQELTPGTVVQLNPETVRNQAFAACFMVVTEPKSFGAQGYIQGIGEDRDSWGGQAYYRANWEEMEIIGTAEWVAGPEHPELPHPITPLNTVESLHGPQQPPAAL